MDILLSWLKEGREEWVKRRRKEIKEEATIQTLMKQNGQIVPENRMQKLEIAREELNIITGVHEKNKLE
ncbi:hypothetical protein A9K97_gp435 [Tokyovirus A1]|uniref:hypothetical protein n=1 Tax=Tokyovirus A1 TaxID=1826170 RepID=UPI0007A98577|nr:hypothetical protein A9K97_gp435 [Tokyovirus A1]BAU79916.1 hypothetical protein [Tokyovirus A1]